MKTKEKEIWKDMNNTDDLLTDLSIILNNSDYFIKLNKDLNELIVNLKDDIVEYYDINNEEDMNQFKKELMKFISNNYIIKLKTNKEYAIKDRNLNLELR